MDNPGYREAPFTRTQAGFVVGGPLKWPAKMPRAFIFASYERQDAHSSLMSHFAVPTVAQRGVFETGETGFRRLRLESIPLFPASVPGNAIFSLFPFPNNPAGPYGANTHTRLLPADGKGTLFSTKLERHFDARGWRNTAIGRYNISDERSVLPVSGGALYSSLSPKLRIQNLAFYVHSQISERTAQTVRLSYGRSSSHFDPVPHYDLTGSSLLAEMPFLLNRPLLLNMTAPNPDGSGKPPSYVSASSPDGAALLRAHGYRSVTHTEQITGPLGRVEIAGFSPLGVDVFSFPQARANNTFQWADTLITLRGPHRLALGFDIRRTQINSFMDRNYRPVLVFHGLRNPVGGVGVPLIGSDGSFLPQEVLTGATLAAAGVPTGLFHTLAANPDSNLGLRFTHFNFFFQDEWRATSNFHLTLGARYQFNTVPGTVGRRLEDAFDRASLERQAEETKTQCPVRCGDLVQGLSVFPKDFGATFGADPNDVAPRVGLVWNLGGAGNTVLRGGFGLYTSVSPGIAMNHSRSAFPLFIPLNLANFAPLAQNRSFLFNLANPSVRELGPELDLVAPNTLNQLTVNNPISLLALNLYSLRGSLSPTYPSLNVVVPSGNLRNPVSYQYAIALEHDFRRWFAGSLSYVGTRGLRLFRVATPDLGVNRSFVQLASDVRPLCFACREFSGGVGGEFPFFAGLMRPPQSDPIARSFTLARTVFESSGSSTYNSLQLEGRCRYNRHYQFGVALTYSHVIDDVSDFFDTAGAFPLPQNSRRRSERASANFDSRLRGVVSFLWDLPPSGTSRWLGGWQLAGIFVSQTGQPFTVNSALDVNRDGNLTDRLHLTDKLILGPLQADPRTRLLLAPGANTLELIAPDGMDGAVGRNAFRAPGLATLDLALTKTFELTARHRIRFRTEAFNFFNRSHFGIPVRILEAPGFGQSVNTAVPARMLQFAVKYLF